jgi:hypothetical protein
MAMATSEALTLLALVSYLAAVVFALRRSGELRRVQGCHIVCPFLLEGVECRVAQDVPSGRWVEVERCSAFGGPGAPICRQECLKSLNAGSHVLRVLSA